MSKKASFWFFLIGTLQSAALFLVAGVVTTAYDLLFMMPAEAAGSFLGAAQLGEGEAI